MGSRAIATIEQKILALVLKDVQSRVDALTKLDGKSANVTVGMAPHHYKDLVLTCSRISNICDSWQFTDVERRRLKEVLGHPPEPLRPRTGEHALHDPGHGAFALRHGFRQRDAVGQGGSSPMISATTPTRRVKIRA